VVTGAGTAFCSGADRGAGDPIEIPEDHRRGTFTNVAREDGRRFGWWRLIEAVWEIFVRRGLPLEAGGAYLLPRNVSIARAKEIAFFGDPLPAATAEEWGLVNRCVPDEQLLDVTHDWAKRLVNLPTIGVGHIKHQLNSSLDSNIRQTFSEEVTLLGVGVGSDGQEAMNAFRERREPRFTGR